MKDKSVFPDVKALDNIGSVIIVTDANRNFIYLNKEAEKFISACGSELCSKLSLGVPEALSPCYSESRSLSLAGADGELRSYFFTRILLGGGILLCVGCEVTEEAESSALPDIIQAVTEHLPAGIIIADLDLRIKYANTAAVSMLRLNGGESWLGRKIYEAFSGKLVGDFCIIDDYCCPFNILSETGEDFKDELFCVGGESPSYIKVSGSVSRDIVGRVNGIVCTLEDCTEVSITRRLLQNSEEKYRLLTEFSPSGVVAFKGSKIVYINPAGAGIFGYESSEVMHGKNILDFIIPADRQTASNVVKNMLAQNKPLYNLHLRAVKADGSGLYLRVSCQPYDDGSGTAVQCVFYDVTKERKRSEEILKLSQVVEQSPVSVVITDANGKIEYVNSAVLKISGYGLDELKGKSADIFKSGVHTADYYAGMWKTVTSGSTWTGELCSKAKDGSVYWEFCTISPVKDPDGEVLFYAAVKENITEKKAREEKIRFMALHDILTGLPNRFLMRDRLEHALERYRRYGEKVAVVFIDLDGFKQVNDRYGHDAGDELLKEISKRIIACIRATDTACRIGGDEFLVIMTDIPERSLLDMIAKRILEAIGRPFIYQGHECRVGASIGISLCPEDGVNTDDLIIRADEAMYYVKRRTKNSFIYFLDLPK